MNTSISYVVHVASPGERVGVRAGSWRKSCAEFRGASDAVRGVVVVSLVSPSHLRNSAGHFLISSNIKFS